MSINNLNYLVFRRQYLLVPGDIDCPFLHDVTRVTEKYTLYTHKDLVINDFILSYRRIILLGDMFDYEDPLKDNMGILKDLSSVNFTALLEMVGRYSGRFVLILVDHGKMILLHDATAARKIYYTSIKDDLWFSSQPHLLAKVTGLKRTTNPSKLEFYESDDLARLNNANLGDTTYFDEISQLMPNHYFDVTARKITRFWPSAKLNRLKIDEATEQCATMIKGYMESISARYKIMLPVTAGSDSRLLMSATGDIKEKILYYINKDEGLSEDSLDIRIPKKMLSNLGIDFNVVNLPTEIDAEFKKVYFENNPLASNIYLPHIYSYYLHFSDRVNLPGHIASAPWGVYRMSSKNITIEKITGHYGVQKYDHAKEYFQNWMDLCHDLCEACNLNVITLFYWEERIANWGAQIALDKDIAQEEFNVFNSRILNEIFLPLPLKYKNIPDKLLYRRIIKRLWPELMKIPFNPSFKKKLQLLLSYLGLFTLTSRLYYKLKKIYSFLRR